MAAILPGRLVGAHWGAHSALGCASTPVASHTLHNHHQRCSCCRPAVLHAMLHLTHIFWHTNFRSLAFHVSSPKSKMREGFQGFLNFQYDIFRHCWYLFKSTHNVLAPPMKGVNVWMEWLYKECEKRFTGFVGTQLPFALLVRVNHYSTTCKLPGVKKNYFWSVWTNFFTIQIFFANHCSLKYVKSVGGVFFKLNMIG